MPRGDFLRDNYKLAGSNADTRPQSQSASHLHHLQTIQKTGLHKKRRFLAIGNTLAKLAVFAVLIACGVFAFNYFHRSADKPIIPRSNSFTGEKPAFSIYYPAKIPTGLNIDKGSIKSSKDIFSFNMNQNGKQDFSVSEQPVEGGFNINAVKKKFNSSFEIKTSLGPGVVGVIDNGTGSLITTVKTEDNTLVIINCVSTVCSSPTKEILDNMKKINDLSNI